MDSKGHTESSKECPARYVDWYGPLEDYLAVEQQVHRRLKSYSRESILKFCDWWDSQIDDRYDFEQMRRCQAVMLKDNSDYHTIIEMLDKYEEAYK